MKNLLFTISIIGSFHVTYCQTLVSLNDISSEVQRIIDLSDTTAIPMIYALKWRSDSPIAAKSRKLGDRFFLHPIRLRTTYNSEYPRSFNDGSLWAGKGISFMGSFGASYKTKNLEITLFPEFSYSQNQAYDVATPTFQTSNPYRYPWNRGIDLPQRFGDQSFTQLYLGQSRIKYTWKNKLYVRLSNENMHWGPSYFNSILMTNTAPGMPHASIGSEDLLHSGIGDFGFGVYWGRMQKSDYFEDNDVEGKFFTGMTFEYQPSFVDGLSLGFGRLLYRRWDPGSIGFEDFFRFLTQFDYSPDSVLGNDEFDQIASLYLQWRFPSVGFEVYFEYARNDFGGDFQNLVIAEPDHSRFYSFGFAKLIESGAGDLRLVTEFNNLSRSNTKLIGPSPVLYVHGVASGGYTHYGQLMGAPIGPGANSQLFMLDLLRENKTYHRVSLQRVSYNDDFYFDARPSNDSLRRDVEMTLGFNSHWQFNKSLIGADVLLSIRDNWYFTRPENTINWFFGVTYSTSF